MIDTKPVKLDTYFSGTSFFPDEMWIEIFQHLNPEEISNLKQTTPHMAKVVSSEQIETIVLLPLLNRLSKIGAEISTDNIDNKNILAAVLEGIKRVNTKQKNELDYLAQKDTDLIYTLDAFLTSSSNIFFLQKRDVLLECINQCFILLKIGDGSNTTLDLESSGITRFPESLMKEKKLQDINYWQKLQFLYCSFNEITKLPALNICVSLQGIHCSDNQLTNLSELNACTNLQELTCHNNWLTNLPELNQCTNLYELNCSSNNLTNLPILTDCTALGSLNCSYNRLTNLPKLNQCTNLYELYCSSNHLTNLPELSACTNLEDFYCSNNFLTSLPQYLLDMGFELGEQNSPHEPALFTPAFDNIEKDNKQTYTEAELNNTPAHDTAESKLNIQKLN